MQFLDLAGVKRIKQYIDDSIVNFITNSVSNLTNYYLKSETYTKSEVEALIAAINQFHYEIAASTSAVSSPANNVLYLIGPTGTGEDKYEEYVYSSSNWVKIGDTSISLSGYVTTQMLNTALADYTNTTTLNTLLAGKQDTINDLSDIRTGSQNNVKYTSQSLTNTQKAQARANIGAGTYSKPSSGIPAADLASGVVSVGLDNTGTLVSNISTINGLKYIDGYDGAVYALGPSNSDGNEDYILATTDQIPTAITTADIQAGTATTARTITAAVLAANYNITDGTINIAGDSITIKTARIEVNNLAGWTSETGYSTLYTTIVNSLKASSNNLWRLAITEDQDPYWPMTYYYLSYFGEEDGFIEFIGSDNTTIALWNNGNVIKSVASPITPGTLITNATTAQTASNGEAMSGTITLHKIAKTGTYSDLIGTPTIPTIESLTTSEIDTIWNSAT